MVRTVTSKRSARVSAVTPVRRPRRYSARANRRSVRRIKPDIQLTFGRRKLLNNRVEAPQLQEILMSQPNQSGRAPKTRCTGSCHCGAVRFEVELNLAAPVSRCNCSICTKLGATGAIVHPEAFKLRSPESDLSTYVWGPVSKRFFCSKCGVYCFA